MSGSSGSDASLSHPSLRFLPFFPPFPGTGGTGAEDTLQTSQRGTLCDIMSSAILVPGTRVLQLIHDAVAKEPWHWMTRCTPASVSSVSMFCV